MANPVEQPVRTKAFRQGLDLGPPHRVTTAAVQDMPVPDRLHVSLKQHRGPICLSKVKAGDEVKMGQVIGETARPDAATVHAPVSGVVASVIEHPDPSGQKVTTVVIDNDGNEEWASPLETNADYMNMDVTDMIRAVRRSGLVDPAGGQPVGYMLSPPERSRAYFFLVGTPTRRPVETLIVNALERDPGQAVDWRVVVEQADELALGVELLKKMTGAKQAVLALSESLASAASDRVSELSLKMTPMVFKNRYPLAAPPILTAAVTGRELPWPGGTPQDVGALVLPAETILGVLAAVRDGRPQIDRLVSLRGPRLQPSNLRVRLGTPVSALMDRAQAELDHTSKVVAGGIMNGMALYDLDSPVTKTTTALHVLDPEALVEIEEHLCIKCGRCVSVCPVRILPSLIGNLCEFGQFDDAENAELFKCIECGCCSYVCPARRPLVHYIKHGKAEVITMRASQ